MNTNDILEALRAWQATDPSDGERAIVRDYINVLEVAPTLEVELGDDHQFHISNEVKCSTCQARGYYVHESFHVVHDCPDCEDEGVVVVRTVLPCDWS